LVYNKNFFSKIICYHFSFILISCIFFCVDHQLLDFDEEEPVNFATVPDCFLSTLKVVKFEYISGNKCELSFAKFVMENAQVLEKISFTCSSKPHVLQNFRKKLASVNCSSNMASEQYYYQPLGDYSPEDY
jgi:hypothetical protein